jgi:hypothetical protein
MSSMTTALGYLLSVVRRRGRAALGGHPESGAITLEWIVIAGILFAAAVAASTLFYHAVKTYMAKIP